MPMVTRNHLKCLALVLPLLLVACRDETGGEAASTIEPAAGAATPAAPAADATAPAPAEPVRTAPPAPEPAPTAAAVCPDCGTVTNVRSYDVKGQASGVGAAVGAVAGGLLGNQIGGGSGKKIATVAGAVGGGLAGHEVEKRRNTETRWEVTVEMDDGSTANLPYSTAPALTVGQKVRVVNGEALPR